MWPFRKRKQPVEVINKATVISIPGPKVKVTLVEAKYFSQKDISKLVKALMVLSYVINSDEFEDRVIWERPGFIKKYTSTDDSSMVIFEKIMKANELYTGDDRELDFSLEYYNSWWSRVVGYTLPSSLWIWMNWKYHLHYTPAETAGNLFHEFCHKIGYGHSSASDHKSVPYALGYLVEELGEKYGDKSLWSPEDIHIDEMFRKELV
jgi:hypothetical protein